MATGNTGRRMLLWGGEIGRLLLSFAITALLARLVAPEILGIYQSITAIALIMPRVLDCGLPHALGYFLRASPGNLRPTAVMIARHVSLATPVALLIALFIRFVPFANAEATTLVQGHWIQLGLYMVSELAILLGLSVFIPTMRFKAYVMTALTAPTLLLVCVAVWPRADLSSGRLLDLLLGSSLAGSLVMWSVLTRAATQGTGEGGAPAAKTYAYGLRSYFAALSKVAAYRFDRLFLVAVLGASGYAQYSLAVSIRDMAIVPANLYATTLRNHQIDLVARRADLAEARRVLCRVSGVWLVLGVVGAAAMYAFWPWVVQLLFGPKLQGAADFIRILAFSCAPLTIMGYAWNHLYALRLPGRVTWLMSLSLLAALPVFALFIHMLGPTTGVAVAAVAWSIGAGVASFTGALLSRPIVDAPAAGTGDGSAG